MRWRHTLPLLLLFVTFGVFFIVLFSRMLVINEKGSFVYQSHVWSDWGLHIFMINRFAHTDPSEWFTHNPAFAYGKFTYPFVVNLISGILIRLGLTLQLAIALPSILFSFAIIAGLYFANFLLSKSRAVSVIAVFLFLTGAGMGFVSFVREFADNPSLQFFLSLKDYSSYGEYQWWTGNIVSGMLLPQRAFLLGFAVGIWIIVGIMYAVLRSSCRYSKEILFFTGIAFGFLPIIHVHTFIVLSILLFFYFLEQRKHVRLLLWFATPAFFLSVFFLLRFVLVGLSSGSFLQWRPGWTATKNIQEWIHLWWKLWGVSIPLSLMGLPILLRKKQMHGWSIALGFLSVFILANLFLFQPNSWDNSKLFAWVYLYVSLCAAYLCVFIWKQSVIGKGVAVFLLLCLCGTGILELIHNLNLKRTPTELNSAEDMRLGFEIRLKTRADAVFLTAPTIHEPIMTWGARQIMMGYWAWAWNYGFDNGKREEDIKQMYTGSDEGLELIRNYQISYVVIGPAEINDVKPNQEFFTRFPVAFSNSSYKVYDVSELSSGLIQP